jgi:UDP-GlcNAc:undecaprenyl-phosphate GlcNAc-1-phosphate transferase
MLNSFYTFMTALFAALVMVPFLRRWALEQGNVDTPDERKVHTTPMPRLGGIAIFLSFLFSSIIYVPIDNGVRGILAGALIIFATGLVDDLSGLSAKRKFAGEIVACLATILVGQVYLTNLGDLFGLGAIILPPWIGVPFTVFAVVGVINAINLIDGLDGLAGGVTIISLSAFFVFGWFDSNTSAAMLAAALFGGVLGFLKYNFYPARIFMGDAGSLTAGFLLGFLAIHLTQYEGSTISPIAPLLVLGLPIVDTIWVMSRRFFKGDSPFSPDRTHVHHKFLNLGFEHRFTVLIIYAITVFWSVFAVLGRNRPDYELLMAFLVISLAGYLAMRFLSHNPHLLSRFMRDADEPLSQTVIFGRLSVLADRSVIFIKSLLALYACLATVSVLQHSSFQWQVAILLLAVSLGLRLWGEDEGGQFAMIVVYAVAGIAAMEIWHASTLTFYGVSVKVMGDIIIAIVAVLSAFKLIFHKGGVFFLATADFLMLSVCTFLAVASQNNALGFNINGPLFRFVLLMFAIRTVLSRDGQSPRTLHTAVMVFLTFVLVVEFVG